MEEKLFQKEKPPEHLEATGLERSEKPKGRKERVRENESDLQKEIEMVRQTAEEHSSDSRKEIAPEERKEKIRKFQERTIPLHLKKPRQVPGSRLMAFSGSVRRFEREHAGENLFPEKGPFLVVCNHSGGETWPLLGLLRNYDTHIAAGKELNFDRSPVRRWLLEKLRMLPVQETLANLNDEEKEALLERVPGETRKKSYKSIIDREKNGERPLANVPFLRQATALLSRGDVVVVFPEGLFLYDEKTGLRKGYGGAEGIAKAYERLTGEPLKIVPIGISKKEDGKIRVGEAFTLEQAAQGNKIEGIMKKMAEQLPKEERGHYN